MGAAGRAAGASPVEVQRITDAAQQQHVVDDVPAQQAAVLLLQGCQGGPACRGRGRRLCVGRRAGRGG